MRARNRRVLGGKGICMFKAGLDNETNLMWGLFSCYSARGAAQEIERHSGTWPVAEGESVGLLVVRFGLSTRIDQRVNPVLVVWMGDRTWIYAKNPTSRLVNDTYDALVSEGITVCGMRQVANLRFVHVDWYA